MTTQSEMTYRSLGRCGTKVSTFGLGGWTTLGESVSGGDEVRSIITAARDAGVNFFDIADVYANGESERAMGKVLGEFPRHELVISSKVFFPMSDDINDRGLSRKHIVESIEKSLKRIGTDYLDIYFCHRFDEETPLEETARAMDDLIRAGKVLYWGVSMWTAAQIEEAVGDADLDQSKHLLPGRCDLFFQVGFRCDERLARVDAIQVGFGQALPLGLAVGC